MEARLLASDVLSKDASSRMGRKWKYLLYFNVWGRIYVGNYCYACGGVLHWNGCYLLKTGNNLIILTNLLGAISFMFIVQIINHNIWFELIINETKHNIISTGQSDYSNSTPI